VGSLDVTWNGESLAQYGNKERLNMSEVQITMHSMCCTKSCDVRHFLAVGLVRLDATIREHVLGQMLNVYYLILPLLYISVGNSGSCTFPAT
jgi:hypothetical protein